jgi:ABC-type thiamine transport system substrate-binding protein
MKQIVKNYAFYPGDFRKNEKSVDIAAQINHDLKKNPGWSVKLLTYIMDGSVCTVVYDISGLNRTLVETLEELVDNTKDEDNILTKASSESSN